MLVVESDGEPRVEQVDAVERRGERESGEVAAYGRRAVVAAAAQHLVDIRPRHVDVEQLDALSLGQVDLVRVVATRRRLANTASRQRVHRHQPTS